MSDDTNTNGIPDFFEVSQGAGGVTMGEYTTPYDQGYVQATWNQSPGTHEGTCLLQLMSNMVDGWGSFTLTFNILEFLGTETYTPGSNTVSGSISLKQSDAAQNSVVGPTDFTK